MPYNEILSTENLPTTLPKLNGMFLDLFGTHEINIPSLVYTIAGVETNLYFEQIVNSPVPKEFREMNFTGATSPQTIGSLFEKFYRNDLAQSSAYTGNLNMLFKGVNQVSKTITVNVASATSGNGITRKVLIIGDSNTASNVTVTTLVDDLTNTTGLKMTAIGTKGNTGYKHEGIAGKTFSFFRSDPTSPFYFSGSFNFAQYLSSNGFTMSSDDWVIFHLGTNDLLTVSPSVLDQRITDMKSDFDAMCSNIKSAVSGIRVGLCLCMPPALSQDSWPASTYISSISRLQFYKALHTWWKEAINVYDTSAQRTAKTYVLGSHATIDTENNFPKVNGNANARNTTQIARYSNAVHPDNSGLNQISDSIRAMLKYYV